MAAAKLEWVAVSSAYNGKRIGAIGFVGDTAVVAVSFFDDADWNEDGKLSALETMGPRIPLVGNLFFRRGRAITQVVLAARGEADVMLRDPSFGREAAKQFTDFATGLVFSGLYTVYFSRAVSTLAGGAARAVADGVVKQYIVRKGMEKLAEAAYNEAMRTQSALR